MPFAQALFESVVQFLAGQAGFAVFEVVAHHGFVDLDDLVDDALMRLGHRGEIGLAARIEEAVDDLGAAFGRQVDRQAFAAEGLAQLFDQQFEIGVGVIDLVDDDEPAQTSCLRVVHQAQGAVFDTERGVDDDGTGLHGPENRQGRTTEIRIAGRVEQVDVHATMVDRRQRALDRMLAFLLHRVVVGHGCAALDRTCRLNGAAGMQQGFEQGGFAGAGMTDECDVADLLGGVCRHCQALPGVEAGWRRAH